MDNFAETPDGYLFALDGLHRPKRWDGLTSTMQDISIAAPTTAVTIAVVDTPGDILGTFTAYARFKDANGLYSDLSPVSNTLTAQWSTTRTVTAATNAEPIAITTSVAHGLSTGNKVEITGVLGNTAANDTWTITVTGASTFTLDDSVGNAAYTSGGTVTVGVSQINYSSVPTASTGVGAAKVTARELLRSTDGQATTYYVDATVADNVTTTASSTKNDDELAVETAVPLLNDDGSLNANRHGVIPNWKRAIAHHLGRMFLTADAVYRDGAVVVTSGSPTVTGINTAFTDEFVGRFLYVTGATASYEISAVSEANQTLTLTGNYAGSTDQYAIYSIRPAPAERRLIYYSEAALPESWPAINAISLQEDGTEITGLMTKGSFLYILTDSRIYRFTYRANPGNDGFVFLSCERGCINQRCFARIEEHTFMLDASGIHDFGGGEESQSLSDPIQALFDTEGDVVAGLKINWEASEQFHCAAYPAEETVRWFVAMSGNYLPRHGICYDYRAGAFWVEEYPRPISASCTGTLNKSRRLYLGSEAQQVLLYGAEQLDGINHNTGTLAGQVSSATQFQLVDLTATFPTASLPGLVVHITAGRGFGQKRIIREASSTVLHVTSPWSVLPDSTSEYQIAGIDWTFRSRWFRYEGGDTLQARKIAMQFQPNADGKAVVRLFNNYSDDPVEWAKWRSADSADGLSSDTEGQTFLDCDLSRSSGHVECKDDGRRDKALDGLRTMCIEVAGVSGVERVRIYSFEFDGAEG